MGFFDRLKKKNETPAETKLVPGIGRMPYPAYRGKGPYVFISYAHADSDRVFQEIARLNEAGFHVWYDEGIAPGNEWTDEIADALSNCTVFIVMLTPVSAPRENVLNEINYALNEKKPFLAIHLEETVLQGGLKLRIGTKQAILKYKMTEEEYLFKLVEALTRFGLRPDTVHTASIQPPDPSADRNLSEPSVPARSENSVESAPLQHTPSDRPVEAAPAPQTPSENSVETAPTQQAPASAPSGYTLSPEALLRIERAKNSEVRPQDFEWIGSTLKGFHGIQRRVEIPARATKIMSEAFRQGLPMEYVRIPRSVQELDFSAFSKCSELKEAIIENPQIRINNVEEIGAFYQCPKVVVYCHKDSVTYDELKRTHTGEIRFIEDRAE